jgi:hypothetical protein
MRTKHFRRTDVYSRSEDEYVERHPSVLRIRIHMFLGLPDPYPDPLVRGMDSDPDPSIIMQK